jgi:peptidyl-prolyl cis-trans isomerase A (cyclophilin A)
MKQLLALSLMLAFTHLAPAAESKEKPAAKPKGVAAKQTFAVVDTTMGKFKLLLFADKVPKTVANFVGLAEGTKEWTDERTGKKSKKPLYDGTIFHRVMDGFMIQGGDPKGDGSGGPGFTIDDEVKPDLKHYKAGILAMAKTQKPNSAGSQFYITVAPQPSLDGTYTVFGEVVDGMDVVYKIAKNKPSAMDPQKPEKPVTIKSVKIERK